VSDRFRVVAQLAERLRARGVQPAAVLQRAGLPANLFQQERATVSTAEHFALWRAIGATSADPGIGLALGAEPRIEHYSPTMIAALCSRHLKDAVTRIGRYKRLTCPEEIRQHASGGAGGGPGGGEVAVEFAYLQADEDEPAVLVDLCLAWILAIGRRGTEGQISPLRIDLRRKAENRELIEGHFACRARFGAARNALVFAARDMERPFVTHNQDLLGAVGMQLERELDAHEAGSDLGGQVKAALMRSLAGRRPTVQHVAHELRMSARTLQRRLTESGSSFQQVAESARRELARHYLGHSAAEFHEVAYLLGYEDANSFFRAFHQWEGTTPGAWRQRHAHPAARRTEPAAAG
jgi:AraC-like DNA-binding protein